MEDIAIGVDLAKCFSNSTAQLDEYGELILRKRLTWDQFRGLMSHHPASSVVFEACGSSVDLAGEMHGVG